jgi:hypothetical protein
MEESLSESINPFHLPETTPGTEKKISTREET